MTAYVVATIKSWNIARFEARVKNWPGEWHLWTRKEDLTSERVAALNPRYIFFPHWSWIVPDDILNRAECVCFHMTDVPYGRGGSPLQNLIVRGHTHTKLTALRMTAEMDAGPVYMKRDLDLGGTAGDILSRASVVAFDMIEEIMKTEPQPLPQQGTVTEFKRRTPDMSVMPTNTDIAGLYDHIRMLDGEGYPPAFLEYGDFILEFTGAEINKEGALTAQVTLRPKDEKKLP